MKIRMVKSMFGDNMQECTGLDLALGHCVMYTEQAPNKTTGNEDSVAVVSVSEKMTVLIVADGMGGYANGAEASRITVESIVESLYANPAEEIRAALIEGIRKAGSVIHRDYPHAGSTVAISVISNATVTTCHAGDSEIMVAGQRGKLKYGIVPHSPVGKAESEGFLTEEQAMFHSKRSVIYNAVGLTNMTLEFGKSFQLGLYDTLILGSDGLFDNLYKKEISQLVCAGKLMDNCKRLRSKCRNRMQRTEPGMPHKPDDTTVILFRLADARDSRLEETLRLEKTIL